MKRGFRLEAPTARLTNAPFVWGSLADLADALNLVRIVEGSLETKVPTIWTDEKQHSQEEAEPGRNSDV